MRNLATVKFLALSNQSLDLGDFPFARATAASSALHGGPCDVFDDNLSGKGATQIAFL